MADEKEPRIRSASILARSEEIRQAEIDGETVMVSIEKGEYYGLDKIGSEIWALLEEPRTVAELCDLLLERYEVGPEECESDVVAFLEDLVSDGSLRVVDRAG